MEDYDNDLLFEKVNFSTAFVNILTLLSIESMTEPILSETVISQEAVLPNEKGDILFSVFARLVDRKLIEFEKVKGEESIINITDEGYNELAEIMSGVYERIEE